MKILQTLYTVYALLLFWVLMILFAPFILFPILIFKKGGALTFYFIRGWARTWCFFTWRGAYRKKHPIHFHF